MQCLNTCLDFLKIIRLYRGLGLTEGSQDAVVSADHTEVLLLCTLVSLKVSGSVAPTGGILDFYSGGAMVTCGLSLDLSDSEGW